MELGRDAVEETRRIQQILGQLRELEGRDLQLWSIAALISLVLVAGFAAVLAPRDGIVAISAHLLAVLLYGLISLVVLYNIYVLQQKRGLRFARAELVRQLMRAEKAEKLAIRDSLTGLFNRRYLDHALETEIKRVSRNDTSLTVMILDLDGFGEINKLFGHLEGDRILVEFARLLTVLLRQTDTAARYGGDEFVVLLPDTDLDAAAIVRRRLLDEVERSNSKSQGKGGTISVSMGLALYESEETAAELVNRADAELRREKKAKGKRRSGVMGILRLALCLALTTAPGLCAAAPEQAAVAADPVLENMAAELGRSIEEYGRLEEAPYYLAYEVTEVQARGVLAAFGKTVERYAQTGRRLDVDLRVGDPTLDNTRAIRGAGGGRGGGERYRFTEMPLDDDSAAMRAVLWRETDRRYREAVEALRAVRTNVRVKVEASDASPDFSPQPAVEFSEPVPFFALDLDDWQGRLERYSEPFAADEHIYQGEARLQATRETRWFVNSEGSRIRVARIAYRLDVSALTKAADGMELPRHETFFAYSPDRLPPEDEILARVHSMVEDLAALRQAPLVEPYAGPAILAGRAAGVFFHEVLGHRIEGHRQKIEEEGQTFKNKVGERILPAGFSVAFDPTLRQLAGHDLAGAYRFDNEGVAARRVDVVEHGIFRHFLMSRSPIAGEPSSNGHGRRQAGFAVVARQSNLLVDVRDPVSRDELKARLLARVAAEGKPFGLYFEDIQGGFTVTGRRMPNAFNVVPIKVFKVHPDGREELVRGVDLIGTPLTAFSKILAGDDTVEVFNGTCGAESGGVPVAAAAPAVLIEQIEVQRKEKSQERPPLLRAPGLNEAAP